MIYYYAHDYYNMTRIGLASIPFFIFGTWAGKESIEGSKVSGMWLLVIFVSLGLLYITPICNWIDFREYLFRITGIAVCCLLLERTTQLRHLHAILRWFGRYTLEIYIIHLMLKGVIGFYFSNGFVQTIGCISGALILCTPVHLMCEGINNKLITRIEYQKGKTD